jgi:chaperonin cofactor prefoldin
LDIKALKSIRDVTQAISDVTNMTEEVETNIKVLKESKEKKAEMYMELLQSIRDKFNNRIPPSTEDKRMIEVRRTQIQAFRDLKWSEMDKLKKLEKQLDELKEQFMTLQ